MADYLGITRPISLIEPSVDEISLSSKLQATVQKMEAFEDADKLKERNCVLEFLEEILKLWILDKYKEKLEQIHKKDNSEPAAVSLCKILPFGGQQLSVVCRGGDLDAVCIVGSFVKREHFFKDFVEVLNRHDEITLLRVVEFARVPIIQICYQDIEIDLCLAILSSQHIPSNIHEHGLDNRILSHMDQTSINSLNGRRETAAVLSLVPNLLTFCETFKVIKLWAKRHCIHHSTMGFPGGIGWAIMVARVCQMYPLAPSVVLVEKFFSTFCTWHWRTPVLLKNIQEPDPYKLSPWNPKLKPSDGFHPMAVITPAYPEKNSTFTVTKSTLSVVTIELQMAAEKIRCLLDKSGADWTTLFAPKVSFFHRYKHYLVLTAKSESRQDSLDWGGLVESRIRVLVASLGEEESVSLVHPHTVGYNEERDKHFLRKWFLGLVISKKAGSALNIESKVSDFREQLHTLACERNILKEGMAATVNHVKRQDIHTYLPATEN